MTLRGRVLNSKGGPAKNAVVSAMVYPSELADQLESLRQQDDADSKATIANERIASVYDTTDSDGKYTLKAAAGLAELGIISTGNFTELDSYLVPIQSDAHNMAPDITLLPIPAIGGVVKDPDGNELSGAIVWLRTHGYSDAMPIAKTNRGAFQLVHNNSQTADNVAEFLKDNGMRFPTVVDDAGGVIGHQYRKYGIYFYPGYILIDPNGKIVRNDGVPDSTNYLRTRKIELIQTAIQNWDWSSAATVR